MDEAVFGQPSTFNFPPWGAWVIYYQLMRLAQGSNFEKDSLVFLRETMENTEQLAFMVGLCHDEWQHQKERGMAEYNFDEWLPFIGKLALQISSGDQTLEARISSKRL